MIKLPGLIDIHVHLRDPEQTYKEDFFTGTSAAVSGGFAYIFDMPNNKKPIFTLKALKEKINLVKKKAVCDIGFYFGSIGDNLDEFKKVKNLVFGLKLYLDQTTGNFLVDKKKLKNIFQTWNDSKPILLHAEGESVNQVLKIVEETGQRVHFCHVGLTDDLKKIISAKKKQLPVTVGVTPHYLFLTKNDVKNLGSFGLMKPPLGTRKDQNYLWKNLKYIDFVESDHAPHTIEEKKSATPPFGVPGLETTLSLLLTAVSEKKLTMKRLIELCYENPKKIFNIITDKNTYVEIDEREEYIIDNKKLFTKCGWSPFNGWKVKGRVKRVFIRGKKVYDNGRLLVKPGYGRFIS